MDSLISEMILNIIDNNFLDDQKTCNFIMNELTF